MKPFARVPFCASGFVTTTLTTPSPCAPVVAVSVVAERIVTFVAATPPIDIVTPTRKWAPVTVIAVPPAVEPEFGTMLVTMGGSPVLYEKPFTRVPVCVSGLVTTTLTSASACAPVVAVISVALTVKIVAGMPPMATVAPFVKSVPPIVTAVPPPIGPNAGVIDCTIGGGT